MKNIVAILAVALFTVSMNVTAQEKKQQHLQKKRPLLKKRLALKKRKKHAQQERKNMLFC